MKFAKNTLNDTNNYVGTNVNEPNLIFENLVWLNSNEAAKYLRKTKGALLISVHRGQIECRKWRRRLFFRKDDLDKMLRDSPILGG